MNNDADDDCLALKKVIRYFQKLRQQIENKSTAEPQIASNKRDKERRERKMTLHCTLSLVSMRNCGHQIKLAV